MLCVSFSSDDNIISEIVKNFEFVSRKLLFVVFYF